MKKQKLFSRFLIPTMLALLLLPPLSCAIFYQSAKQYAYSEAAENLEEFQQKLLPVMRESFLMGTAGADEKSDIGEESKADGTTTEKIRSFLLKIVPLSTQMGGNAQLMILESRMRMIYPRDELLRTELASLAKEFSDYIQGSGSLSGDETVEFSSVSGENYLINVYEVPTKSVQIKYVIAYCSTSQIGGWVGKASRMVLLISGLFVLAAAAILWLTTRSVTRPLQRLCREAPRIGGGDFAEIPARFSIRELEELRLSMNGMAQELEAAEAAQKNFFQNVSHELRNPLMSISGYAQGIEQGVFPSPQKAAHTILEESARLTELVSGLLTLSRMESGEQEAALGPVVLLDVIEDCLDRVHGLALQRGISLILSPFERDLTAVGEEDLIQKVLENLLTNAIRYAKQAVTVSVLSVEDAVSIVVADDGDGIAEQDLPHIFERCYKGKGGNFGIGLAIARSAAQQMGGSLQAVNFPKGGAVFTLSLARN